MFLFMLVPARLHEMTMKNEKLKIQLEEKEKAVVVMATMREPVRELPEVDTARQVRETHAHCTHAHIHTHTHIVQSKVHFGYKDL